jgi:hypothetical protein
MENNYNLNRHQNSFLKQILLIYIFLIFSNTFYSQVQQEWIANYHSPGGGVSVESIILDKYANIYITGVNTTLTQNNNYITIKYNTNGVQQWANEYNGPPGQGIDHATAIGLDNFGNVYVTGYSMQTNSLENPDIATIKYNSNGVQQWVRRYDDTAHQADIGYALEIDKNGFIYVTGLASRGDMYGRSDYITIKYNSNGDTLWVKRYKGNDYNPIFGPSSGGANSIAVDDSGYIYVTGASGVPTGPDPSNIATIKYDQNGDSVWVKKYSTNGRDVGYKVLVDNLGNVFVTGIDNFGTRNITIKYNSAGVQQWVQAFDGTTFQKNTGVLDKNGNIFLTGSADFNLGSNYDYLTLKYSTSGVQQWMQRFNGTGNGTDYAYDITIDDSNNVYVTGSSLNANQQYEFVTIKYNTSGVQQWLITSPGGGHNIAVDSLRNVYVTGTNSLDSSICTIKYSQITGVIKTSNEIPLAYKLGQNYPNPFNPNTKIKYDVTANGKGQTADVKLIIYDVLGKTISVLVNEHQKPGKYEVDFKGNEFSSGIYFYSMYINGEKIDTKMMALIK